MLRHAPHIRLVGHFLTLSEHAVLAQTCKLLRVEAMKPSAFEVVELRMSSAKRSEHPVDVGLFLTRGYFSSLRVLRAEGLTLERELVFPDLQELFVRGCKNLPPIRAPELKKLELHSLCFGDGWENCMFPQLKELTLIHLTLRHLPAIAPGLETLNIRRCSIASMQGVTHLSQLKHLFLLDLTMAWGDHLQLGGLTQLRHVFLGELKATIVFPPCLTAVSISAPLLARYNLEGVKVLHAYNTWGSPHPPRIPSTVEVLGMPQNMMERPQSGTSAETLSTLPPVKMLSLVRCRLPANLPEILQSKTVELLDLTDAIGPAFTVPVRWDFSVLVGLMRSCPALKCIITGPAHVYLRGGMHNVRDSEVLYRARDQLPLYNLYFEPTDPEDPWGVDSFCVLAEAECSRLSR